MAGTFQNMGILLTTLVPVISMRLFSAEFSAGTAELLLTLPLDPWQIVVGKYLGAVSILVLMTAGTVVDLVPLYLFRHAGDDDDSRRVPRFRPARHGVSRRGPVLLDADG